MTIADINEISTLIAAAIAAGATLIAVLLTSLFNYKTAKLNNQTQIKQKIKELKLERIEELYLLFDKWQINFSSIYIFHYRCYIGKLTYSQVLEGTTKLDLLAPGEHQKYQMIMTVHFHPLLKDYERIEKARRLIAPFLSDPLGSGLSAQDFERYQINFEQESELFKTKISALAHKILED